MVIIRCSLALLDVANDINGFLKIGPFSYLCGRVLPPPPPQGHRSDAGGRPQPDVPGNQATAAMAGFPGSAQDGLLFLN